ncbi:MAG: putative nucleoside-diphosphate sugar epimerase [bacterium P201]|nr:MAG: putative nucleoside-diphosphate sugar epimerase [bacterium P201]
MRKLVTRICNFIFGKHKNNTLPRYWILATDMAIVFIAYVIAVVLVYFNDISKLNLIVDWKRVWLFPLVYLISFLLSKTYDGMLRYSGFNDIRKIFSACTWTLLFIVFSKWLFIKFYHPFAVNFYPPFTIIGYHYLITLVLMIMLRFTIRRLYNEVYKNVSNKINTIIYGAGDGGTILFRTLEQDTYSKYKIKAFVDDDPKRVGSQINTIKVYAPNEVMTEEYILKNNIEVLIIAIPSLDEKRRKEIIEQGLALNLDVKSVPSFDKWVDGKLSTSQIQDIKIEDLLGRQPITLSNENVSREICDKVVLVTGAAGSIGSEICRQAMLYQPKQLIMLDQAESPLYDFQFEMNNTVQFKEMKDRMAYVITNVKDPVRMREVFEKYHPQVVFHAAAYKHVPFMEENPYEAVYVNVFGTKLVADLATEYGVEKFVMISTDKAVNPTNVMGATKRIAEIYTQSRKGQTKFITTRFGNVLGSNGSVVPLFRKQIEQGGPITVTDRRITRYFMTIPEACSLVLEAGAIGEGGDIFVFDMGEKIKIWDLAEKMRKLAHRPDVEIIETGLRPGEKLYEEVLANEENTIKTDNEKIMHAVVRKYETEEVDGMIEKLQNELETCDPMKIVAQMKAIVPEFKSNNSIFSQLD